MRNRIKLIAGAIVLLAAVGSAQQDAFFPMGAIGGVIQGNNQSFLPDARALGANWVWVYSNGCGGVAATLQRLTEIQNSGMKALLFAGLDSGPNLCQIASGQTWLYESETDLHGTDTIGDLVHDDSALNQHQALAVSSQSDAAGWFQTAPTSDYILNAINFDYFPDGAMPYTAFYRLRADTGNCLPTDTVCRLAVTEVESLGASETTLAYGDNPRIFC